MPRRKTKRNYKTKRRGKKVKKTRRRRGGLQPSKRTLLIMKVRSVMNDDLKNKSISQEIYDCIVREKLIENEITKLISRGLADNMSPSEIFTIVYGEALNECE